MPTYSPADFENSPFNYRDRVRVHLYDRQGRMVGTITGRVHAREQDVDVGRTPDGQPMYKTLYWVREIEGYQRPHPELPGHTEAIEEGWFAEQDLQKIGEADDAPRPLPNLHFN